MNKKIVDAVLVVEGHNDESYLSSFLDVEIVTTNGLDIPELEIEYLREIGKKKRIIILVDPDLEGRNISQKLHELLPNSIDLLVDISQCHKNNKKGIAECDKNEIIRVLSPFFVEKLNTNNVITYYDCLNFNICNKEKRQDICHHFHLGICNSKKMVQRINSLGISIKEIEEYCHGN